MDRTIRLGEKYYAAYWIEASKATGCRMLTTARNTSFDDVVKYMYEGYIKHFFPPIETALVLVKLRDFEVKYFEKHISDTALMQAGRFLVESVEEHRGVNQAVEVSSELFFETVRAQCDAELAQAA